MTSLWRHSRLTYYDLGPNCLTKGVELLPGEVWQVWKRNSQYFRSYLRKNTGGLWAPSVVSLQKDIDSTRVRVKTNMERRSSLEHTPYSLQKDIHSARVCGFKPTWSVVSLQKDMHSTRVRVKPTWSVISLQQDILSAGRLEQQTHLQTGRPGADHAVLSPNDVTGRSGDAAGVSWAPVRGGRTAEERQQQQRDPAPCCHQTDAAGCNGEKRESMVSAGADSRGWGHMGHDPSLGPGAPQACQGHHQLIRGTTGGLAGAPQNFQATPHTCQGYHRRARSTPA